MAQREYDLEELTIENSRCIEELRLWILNHLDERHSLRKLAEGAGMSISKMQRLFNDAYGISVVAYIRIERLMRAQKQLEVTAMNIKTISAEAGYSSVPAFTAAFSSAFGEAPARFRRATK
jgi:transcriptional regulator GlxA family with amidase domain